MNTEVIGAEVDFFHQPFVRPLQLSSGVITEITEARACVTVRVNGIEASGRGSIYLSDLWAWPESPLSHEQRDAILRQFCTRIAHDLYALCGGEAAHPLELGLRLHHALCDHTLPRSTAALPALARIMCGSPFDAAIHDAVGQALNCSAFDFYSKDFCSEPVSLPGADRFFTYNNAAIAVRRIIERPRTKLPAWLVVGPNDCLQRDVAPLVRAHGYGCFKLKLVGRDNDFDIRRTVEVFHAMRNLGVGQPRLSVDSNEGNPDAASVLDYLERLKALDLDAFAALEYLEQPTSRDLIRHANDWRAVARLKPVLLDEGLAGLESLEDAMEQGWSGLALKTCKGHSFALIAAAWARERGVLISLQDLTNPGLAAIHAALFAAHVPMLNGVEINSPQYTPAANSDWLPHLNGLFEPRNGYHHLQFLPTAGLGSTLAATLNT